MYYKPTQGLFCNLCMNTHCCAFFKVGPMPLRLLIKSDAYNAATTFQLQTLKSHRIVKPTSVMMADKGICVKITFYPSRLGNPGPKTQDPKQGKKRTASRTKWERYESR